MSAATLVLAPEPCTHLSQLIGDITGRDLGALPWVSPALLLRGPSGAPSLDLPVADGGILIHDYQSVTWLSAVTAGTNYVVEVTHQTKGPVTEIDTQLCCEGVRVVAMKTALRQVARSMIGEARPAAPVADEGALCITQAQVARYLALSGDPNPIHSDPADAQALGFAAPIVPGMLLMALVQAFAPRLELPALTARFLAPLIVGEPFRVALTDREPGQWRATVAAADRPVAIISLRETAPSGS